MTDWNQLYVDGGCIGRNPSEIGGTWAARLVYGNEVIKEESGTITPQQAGLPEITNNLSEMAALIKGLRMLPDDWCGVIYTDSQITLGRAAWGWRWHGIPDWMFRAFGLQTARLKHWGEIRFVLLAGHPTKAQLEAGVGRNDLPVSAHNVAVDLLCKQEADKYKAAQVVTA